MTKKNEIKQYKDGDVIPLIQRAVMNVREDMRDDPYVKEALKVLPAGGYRSAIGSYWNAVVNDLRHKIIFRGLHLFNKEMALGKTIKNYDDFRDHVNDDQLIEGAYKIGVIGWEAFKILKSSKEARHVFYGHPESSDPSLVKVLAVIDDCNKYVLNEEYPQRIIDIDEYVEVLKTAGYDRNEVAAQNAIGDLPENYKNELANRLFTIYIHPDSTSTLISNVEFISPILWKSLPKPIKIQIARRVDQVVAKQNAHSTKMAFQYIRNVNANIYLSTSSRLAVVSPLVKALKENLDNWTVENTTVRDLKLYCNIIPTELRSDYVWGLTHTFVGRVGSSAHFARTDFYANGAAVEIPGMFEQFDDEMCQEFCNAVRSSDLLKSRIRSPSKIRRLRTLGNILTERMSEAFADKKVIEYLCDETKEGEFYRLIGA